MASAFVWLCALPCFCLDVIRMLVFVSQEQGRRLPRWPLANVFAGCMTGSHGIVAFAEAIVKGLGGVNVSQAYQVMIDAVALQDGTGCLLKLTEVHVQGRQHAFVCVCMHVCVTLSAQGQYSTLGFVPAEEADDAASLTLEYAFDDGILAFVAQHMNDTHTAEVYGPRALNYRYERVTPPFSVWLSGLSGPWTSPDRAISPPPSLR